MSTPRYAIYFVPGAETALYRFGAAVLGTDCYTGGEVALIDGVDAGSWREFVREPRIYGFHATLKAPFRLAEGASEAGLEEALLAFAADQPAVLLGELAVREIGAFIALVPKTQRPPLDRLAQACVRDLDHFRAPMGGEERARRLTSSLTPRQIEHLDRWGYPYVFEDFRFHMTLTGALAPPERQRALQFLCAKFEQMPGARAETLDRLVIARQMHGTAPFQVLRQAPLGDSGLRPYAYSC